MSDDFDGFGDFEKNVIDIDEVQGTDIKINPAYYLHLALVQCQNALKQEVMTDRIMAYRMAVDHLESLARAANLLDDDFKADCKVEDKDLKDKKEDVAAFIQAKQIFRALAKRVFSNQMITTPLKA